MLSLILFFLSFFHSLVDIVPKIHNFKVFNVNISKEIYWLLCFIYGCIFGKLINLIIKKCLYYIL
jgi:hypothetical protein